MKRKIFGFSLFLAGAIGWWAAFAHAGEPNIAVNSGGYVASFVAKSKPGVIYNLTTNYHTAAYRTLFLFDATALPSNGAVTDCANGTPHTAGCVLWCFEGDTQAGGSTETYSSKSWTNVGLPFDNGLVIAASTSTSGCASLTVDWSNEKYSAQIDPR